MLEEQELCGRDRNCVGGTAALLKGIQLKVSGRNWN